MRIEPSWRFPHYPKCAWWRRPRYIKRLADIDFEVLSELIRASVSTSEAATR